MGFRSSPSLKPYGRYSRIWSEYHGIGIIQDMSEMFDLLSLLWAASSKRDFIEMPEEVVKDFGHWLFLVQKGKNPKNAKPLSGFGGAQVMELWRDHKGKKR